VDHLGYTSLDTGLVTEIGYILSAFSDYYASLGYLLEWVERSTSLVETRERRVISSSVS
jgi:hypothetical protein